MKGLLGGQSTVRQKLGMRSRVDDPLFLDPLDSEEDLRRLNEFISTEHPLEVEIGPGRGHFIRDLAAGRPEHRFLVVEARLKYTMMSLKRLHDVNADNARIVMGDARELLPRLVPPGRLAALYVLFPDPWWKHKHEKRRLMGPEFLLEIWRLLAQDGLFLFRTDVRDYDLMVQALLAEQAPNWRSVPCPEGVPLSHRQMKCREYGQQIWENCVRRKEPLP